MRFHYAKREVVKVDLVPLFWLLAVLGLAWLLRPARVKPKR